MPYGFVAAAISVAGLVAQKSAAKKQAKQQQAALDLQAKQFDTQLAASNPFGEERKQYAEQLKVLMNNPNAVTELPGYKFQMEQGTDAITRSGAASGFLGSGNLAAELTKYGQGLASSFYDRQVNLLSSLAGAGAVPGAPNNPGAGAGIAAANNNYNATGDFYASLGHLAGSFSGYGGGGGFGSGSFGGTGAGGGAGSGGAALGGASTAMWA